MVHLHDEEEPHYDDNTIQVMYSSQGDVITNEILLERRPIVLEYTDRRLVDVTQSYLSDPEHRVEYEDNEDYAIEVSPLEVVAGRGSYTLTIRALSSVDVRIHFRRNDDPVEVFTARLDDAGEAEFQVGADTGKGSYDFIGFNLPGTKRWIRAEAMILVR